MWDKEDTGEECDLTGDTDDDGDVGGCCDDEGDVIAGRCCFTAASPRGLLLVLLLLINFIMCSCSLALVSAFFSHSSCRISCWVKGLVTLNLRNCWRIRGSSSGEHIFHLSRLLPLESCNKEYFSVILDDIGILINQVSIIHELPEDTTFSPPLEYIRVGSPGLTIRSSAALP